MTRARWTSLITKLRSRSGVFCRNDKGSTAMIFALSALPALAAVGMSLDYFSAIRSRHNLQSAVDAAALAGSAALTKGQTTTVASQLAQSTLLANMGSLSGSTTVQNVKSSIENQTASTVIAAQLSLPGQFSKLLGLSSSAISANATAQAFIGKTTKTGKYYSGKGAIADDPEIAFADGSGGFIDCPPGNWYNVLSDAGIQINFACRTASDGYNLIKYMTVMLGNHVITYNSYLGPQTQYAMSGVGYYAQMWPAQITVDGVPYTPPQVVYSVPWPNAPPANTVISDTSGKVTITPINDAYANYALTGYYSYMSIDVTTSTYTAHLYYENGWGGINFAATNAGVCGVPGGAWGASLGGLNVGYSQPYNGGLTQISSYQVSGPTAKSPEFYWSSNCAAATAIVTAGTPHLIQ